MRGNAQLALDHIEQLIDAALNDFSYETTDDKGRPCNAFHPNLIPSGWWTSCREAVRVLFGRKSEWYRTIVAETRGACDLNQVEEIVNTLRASKDEYVRRAGARGSASDQVEPLESKDTNSQNDAPASSASDGAGEHARPPTDSADAHDVVDLRNGKRLFGWHDILKALGSRNDPNTRRRVKRYAKAAAGPIGYVKRRPTCDEGALLAWWTALESRVATAHASNDATRIELAHHAERKKLKLHSEARPNAKGKARPAAEGPTQN